MLSSSVGHTGLGPMLTNGNHGQRIDVVARVQRATTKKQV